MVAITALVGAAMGLAELVPEVAGWFGGDDAENAARTVVDTAKKITGTDDAAQAKRALQENPELALRFREAVLAHRAKVMEEETKRLRTVNETMRAEYKADDKFVRRWRPFFGYIVALTWAIQFGGVTWAMIDTPEYAAELINALVALTPVWGIALAVLGVNVAKRSEDKKTAAGVPTPSVFGAIAQRIAAPAK